MLVLSATQDALARRPSATPVLFVVLTTWTNRAAGTVQSRFFWSNRELYYPYDGTDRLFRGALLPGRGLGTIVRRLGELRPQPVTLQVGNESILGTRLWSTLRAANLYGATVEIARHYTADPTGAKLPRSIPAADHTVIYRGELESVSESDGVITLGFESQRPELFLLEAFGDLVPKKDFGARYPYPIGEFERVRAVIIEAGAQTTLAQGITIDQLADMEVTDASRFPAAGAFSAWINGEEVLFARRTGNYLSPSARAQSGTRAAAHKAGDVIVEIRDVKLAVGGAKIESVKELFVRAPSGELVRLPIFDFTQSFTPSGSTLTISATALRSILTQVFVSATVTVQPAFATDSGV